MLKRFIAYYKPHRKMLTLDLLASFLISVIGLIYPMLTRHMLKNLIPNSDNQEVVKEIIFFGVLLFTLYFVRMLLRFFVQYYGHVIGVKMQAQMRRDLFIKLQKLPYSYYDNHETGKIMSRMTNDLMDVSELAHHGPENFFICGVMVIGSFIYLCTINLQLTLVVFACVPLLICVALVMRKKMREAFTESRKSIAVINGQLESSISGIRVTKAFNNAAKETEKFEVGNTAYVTARSKAYKAMGQFSSSTSFITDIFNVICLIAGGLIMYRIGEEGGFDTADYTTFITSIGLFISPVMTLINFVEQYQNGVTGFTRFLEILDEPIEKENENAVDIETLEGQIEFKNVSFAYTEDVGVLENISFTIEKGKTVALVGPSGGGKTTICHLLPNFYKVTEGEILVDGVNINDITFYSLRKNIGIVQQDVFLFNGTILDNILYGRLDASFEEVVEAAKRANIYDYIMDLPDGFLTEIGERGVRLSGGQKQRLSIARVFLKNPSILILDEATSALDNATEILIQKALDELCKGRTTIVVAHRLSTIKNADEIIVISDGKIIEHGSHEELLEQKGEYYSLYSLQFKQNDYLK